MSFNSRINSKDIPIFNGSNNGLVPNPGSQNDFFLRDDGTWQTAGNSSSNVLIATDFIELNSNINTSATEGNPSVLLTLDYTPVDENNFILIWFSASGRAEKVTSMKLFFGLGTSENFIRATSLYSDANDAASSCALIHKQPFLGPGSHRIRIRWGIKNGEGGTSRIRPNTGANDGFDHASLLIQEVTI